MAKTRMMKHDLRTSEKVASWPIPIRYFWTLLWGYVDDHGKAKDNPLLVKADCFPLDPDITAETIDEWLWHLTDAHVVVRYTVEGTDYLAVINWGEHQKPPHPTKDVLPAFDDPRATRRDLHASRMKDAGEPSAPFTHGLGWVGSGFDLGFGSESSPPAMVPAIHPYRTFDDFWAIWPRKVGKGEAKKAWDKAALKKSPDELFAAALAYAEHKHRPAKQFVPHPATWLNGERWDDELPEPPEAEKRTQSPGDRAMQTVNLGRPMLATELLGLEQ